MFSALKIRFYCVWVLVLSFFRSTFRLIGPDGAASMFPLRLLGITDCQAALPPSVVFASGRLCSPPLATISFLVLVEDASPATSFFWHLSGRRFWSNRHLHCGRPSFLFGIAVVASCAWVFQAFVCSSVRCLVCPAFILVCAVSTVLVPVCFLLSAWGSVERYQAIFVP